jgi:predicted permease
MSGIGHDWRDAVRGLRHSPGFAAVAILTIAFAIGLSTAVFSLAHGILLEPLPYEHAERLVRLAEFNPQSPLEALRSGRVGIEATGGTLSDVTIGQWTGTGETLDAVVPMSTRGSNVVTRTGTEQRLVGEVGGRFFEALSVHPAAGRLLQVADASAEAPKVAVVSVSFLPELDDGTGVIGRPLRVEDETYTIVGVAPEIALPEPGVDVWVPGTWSWPQPGASRMFSLSLDVIGRMKPDVTVADVQAEGERIVLDIAAAHPNFFEGTVPVPVVRVRRLLDDVVAPVRPALVVLSIGMGLVLAAACVNLANLVLARTTARRRDVAVRLALGASRGRIGRPLFLEQLLLAVAGSTLGAALAWWTLGALPWLAPADLPRLAEVDFNLWSLLFASLAALFTATVAGLLPVWQLRRRGRRGVAPLDSLRARSDTPATDRTRSALVVCQVALAAMLLVGAALVGRSLVALLDVDSGYDPEGVLTFHASPPDLWWRQEGRQSAFVGGLVERLSAQPGVVAAGASSGLPMRSTPSAGSFTVVGRPRPEDPADFPVANNRVITPGYLAAVGTPVVQGRGLLDSDRTGSEPVILIDETLASRYFPGEEPVGQRLLAFGRREWTIVGVVRATRDVDMATPAEPMTYFPAAQMPEIAASMGDWSGLAVRTTGDPVALAPFIRAAARELEPTWPIYRIGRLTDRMSEGMAQPRFYTLALGLFAMLALTTAVLGVYGVLAYAVERRRREFSVRRALGASEAHVLGLVVGRGLWLAGAGLCAGLAAAAAGTSLLRAQLFGVEPLDAVSFAAAAGLLLAVVVLASWWPARRALRVSPAEALEAD